MQEGKFQLLLKLVESVEDVDRPIPTPKPLSKYLVEAYGFLSSHVFGVAMATLSVVIGKQRFF